LSLPKVTVASQVEQQKTSHTLGPLRDLCNDILEVRDIHATQLQTNACC
jgi:hypothetical protein